ncbi:MAG TPA: hypothetical protein VF746_23855, partial [Longimicrobium sp.]
MRTPRRWLWMVLGALAAAGCGGRAEAPPPCPAPRVAQEGWRAVERYPLSFRLPPGFRELDAVSTDQWSRRYEAAEGPA